ncbi:MAG: ATP-dependent helicase [Proteobacteria bacterium]|nr:ATP-dependent helicase [Pseudomonadota bacterium]MBU1708449.1 ATP-dependent helicase [Pseudomonadota bacterium]
MQQSLFSSGPSPAKSTASVITRQALNEAQYQAVTSKDGPVLVIAGAGSGKTRTLVYRVAFLVEQGILPENILLLTFTRKAAQEMLHRASLLLDETCRQVTGGTFHAVANLLLRRYAGIIGYPNNFTILDQADAEGIINLIKSSLELGGAGKRFPSKRVIINIFSRAVNKAISLDDVIENQYAHLSEYFDDLVRIRDHYKKFKMEHGLMDYDDLLVNWQTILADYPEARQEIAARFQYILVDEYQDTNPIQARIVRLLAHKHDNVMVVGDDAQSIYSFRGADFRNIMDFPSIFPGATIVRLEENYRSTQKILSTTNAIIDNAREKYTKTLFSNIEGGDTPVLFGARNESEQARFIVETILAIHKKGTALNDIAVLFRSGFHSYKLELELANRQIIFEKRGGQKLTESAHTKDVLSYLRIITNPSDNLSWNRILLQIDKIGPKTAGKILEYIKGSEDPTAALARYPGGAKWQHGLQSLSDVLTALYDPNLSPVQQFDLVMDYYRPIFERIFHDDYPRRSKDLDQLREILQGYESLQGFIDDTALDPPAAGDMGTLDDDRMILSTIHSAKGLEWDTVFIIHLTEGKFPPAQAFLPEHFEEERRLLYVAATRAKNRLFLTYPREVMSPEHYMTMGTISPLVAEIPPSLLSKPGAAGVDFPREKTAADRPIPQNDSKDEFAVGASVRHPFFGEGKILSLAGPRTVNVFFNRHGNKTLHLDYAKLEHV